MIDNEAYHESDPEWRRRRHGRVIGGLMAIWMTVLWGVVWYISR